MPLGIPHSRFLSWDPEDQDKALAYMRLRAETCSCGTRMEQWDKDRFAFVTETWRCPGCELLEMEQANIPEKAKGVRVTLIPNDHAEE